MALAFLAVGRQRVAVSVAFTAYGAVMGSWVPRLPAIKEHLGLSDGQVGFALLAVAVGAIIGAAGARFALNHGARFWVRTGTVVLCVTLLGPAVAGQFLVLLAAMTLLGAASGFIDVIENAQAADLERQAKRPLINGFHAFWSLGALLGSVVAAVAAHAGVAPTIQFAFAAVLLTVVSAPFLRQLPDTHGGIRDPVAGDATRWRLGAAVGALAAIAFCGILVEGGGGDWSAVYLRDIAHADPGLAASGYAGFALAMTLVRFGADRLTARTSPELVAALGGLLAAAGLAVAIALPVVPGALIGFTLVGAGVAVVIPLAFSAGANLGRSATALSLVAASAYAGSIAGPFLIGNVADRLGLRAALAIPLIAALVIVALARSLRRVIAPVALDEVGLN
jgi:MFS family permease